MVNGLVALPSWVEIIYVIPLYGVSLGLNLNLRSVGGRCLKLTDYYRAEARRYLPDRAENVARPCEAEARPSQLKNASRPPRAEADASRTTSLTIILLIVRVWSGEMRENDIKLHYIVCVLSALLGSQ